MDIKISDKVKYVNGILCEVEKIYQLLLSQGNLSDSEYVLLFSIVEMGEGCLQKDIADRSYISKKTLNSTVKKMEQEGLIALKSGKYPNMHIYLTDKGREYVSKRILPIISTQNKMMESISDEDFENFVGNVSKYLNVFKQNVEV